MTWEGLGKAGERIQRRASLGWCLLWSLAGVVGTIRGIGDLFGGQGGQLLVGGIACLGLAAWRWHSYFGPERIRPATSGWRRNSSQDSRATGSPEVSLTSSPPDSGSGGQAQVVQNAFGFQS